MLPIAEVTLHYAVDAKRCIQRQITVESQNTEAIVDRTHGQYLAVAQLDHVVDDVQTAAHRENLTTIAIETRIQGRWKCCPGGTRIECHFRKIDTNRVRILLRSTGSEVPLIVGGDR